LKKAGKKSKELEDKWGPIPLHLYTYVSEDVLKKLIAARIAHEDCNAGVMFDNLHCDYWPNELYLMKCLLEVVGEKSLQIVILKEQHDSHGLDICKVIEWEGMQDLALKDEDKEKPVANEEELDAKNRKGKATKREEKKPKEKEQPKLKQE
jgi:hydrocephalus-inducing protein